MRIRRRLIGLLVGMLSLGTAVTVFPAGSEAASNKSQAKAAAPSPQCTAVKQFVKEEKSLIGNDLPGPVKKEYNATLAEIQNSACRDELTCGPTHALVAELRSIRGDQLASIEAELRALETEVLQLACSS